MITDKTLEKINALTAQITEAGKVAVPVPDTPLSVLCSHSTLTGLKDVETASNQLLEESNNNSHNDYQDGYVKAITEAVANHIDFAKNVVNPSIREVVAYVSNTLDEYTETAINDIKIVRVTQPDFLNNSDIKSDIEGYASRGVTAYIEPDSFFSLSNYVHDELVEKLVTGSSNLDLSIRTWVASQEPGFLKDIWELFFADPKTHAMNKQDMVSYLNHPVKGTNRALAIYLFCRRLENESKEDSVSYNARLKQYREVASFKAAELIEKYEEAKQRSRIVQYYDFTEKTIYVYSDLYVTWLEKGNKPELLFGAFINNESLISEAELSGNSERLLKSWSTYKAALNNSHRNTYYNKYIEALRQGFYSSMADMLEAEQEYYEANTDAKDTVAKLLEEELKHITIEDRKDHYRTVARLVCKARYFYTDVYKFLTTVDNLTTNNDNTLEEALQVATIEYVTDYVSSMLVVR
jgi:hypothetical protein